MIQIFIKKEEENQILKDFISKSFKELSLSKISKSIKNGDIKVNHKKTTWNYKLQENDSLQIFLRLKPIKKEPKFNFLEAKPILNVIYEDKNIIVVSKPRGLICQPDKNERIDTLNNRIKKYLYEKKDKNYLETNLCHRLDKYTTGLCVAAKNQKTVTELNDLWNTDVVSKYYLCLCYGKFKKKSDTLKDFIFLNEEKQIMEIDKENKFNKEIITKYRVIEQKKDMALLEIQLLTGKKHQIRVHMASIGHPVLGDTKYNKKGNFGFQFPCLTSYKIKFNFDKNHFLHYLNKLNLEVKNIKFK